MILTNWHVITGAPSSGKTTLINKLAQLGYHTSSEVARDCITKVLARNHTLEEIEQERLQENILNTMVEREKNLPIDELIFFDRGLPDSLAYYSYHHLDTTKVIKACQKFHYKTIFYCHSLPFEQDTVRIENEAIAQKIGEYIYDAYRQLGYKLIELPVLSVEKRLEIILSHIEKT